jgi:hypothetical protein
MTITAYAKDDFYCNHFSMDMFLSLIIKVFRFVPTSEHVSSSMCQCTWRAKGTGGPPLLILPHFISSVLLVLQLALAVSILRHAVVISEGSSKLDVLSKVLPFHYLICFSQHVWELDVALWLALFGGSFVFLDVGPSILFLVFPLFWVLWFFL